jgi:hypothetical protein
MPSPFRSSLHGMNFRVIYRLRFASAIPTRTCIGPAIGDAHPGHGIASAMLFRVGSESGKLNYFISNVMKKTFKNSSTWLEVGSVMMHGARYSDRCANFNGKFNIN